MPLAQSYLDGGGPRREASAAVSRQDAALHYLAAVHAAQRQAYADGGRYAALDELRRLPDVPLGLATAATASALGSSAFGLRSAVPQSMN